MAATQTQNRETAPMPGRRHQVPADGAPIIGAPADGAPIIGTHADGAPADGGAADGTAADREAADHAPAGRAPAGRRRDLAGALRPLLIDIGIPVGTYYLLRGAFGVSLWLSL